MNENNPNEIHRMENSPVIKGAGYTRCSCGHLSKGAYSREAHESHVKEQTRGVRRGE